MNAKKNDSFSVNNFGSPKKSSSYTNMVVSNVRPAGHSFSPTYGSNENLDSNIRSTLGYNLSSNLPPNSFNFNFSSNINNQSNITSSSNQNMVNTSAFAHEFSKKSSTSGTSTRMQDNIDKAQYQGSKNNSYNWN